MQSRRTFLGAMAGTLAYPNIIAARAQESFPAREIHIMCGFAAGSAPDLYHRFFAERLRQLSGRPVVVENRPGVQGALAMGLVAKAKPDGYTISFNGGTGLASPLVLLKTPGFASTDFESLSGVWDAPWVVVVSAKSPFNSLQDLTEHLQKKGSKASYGTATTVGTIVGELYKSVARHETVQVNYRTSADTLNDLLAGNIDFATTGSGFALGQTAKGSVRALAVSSAKRVNAMPGIPTFVEGGVPGIAVSGWASALVPAGTPPNVTEKLNTWFGEIARMPETVKFLAADGADVMLETPAEIKARLDQEIKKWVEYIRVAKIEPM